MKLWEGVLVSGLAFLMGYLAAYVHVFHFGAALFAPVLKGWATLYPQFALTPTVDGLQLLSLALLRHRALHGRHAGAVWRAAITDPDAVMRGLMTMPDRTRRHRQGLQPRASRTRYWALSGIDLVIDNGRR